MPTCPNGHQSGSEDWCEVCGHRMAGPSAPPGGGSPPSYGYPGQNDPNATAVAELCPQCRTPREGVSSYCEECRYNFLTHTATSYTPLAPAPQPQSGLNLPSGFTSQPPPGSPAHQGPQGGHHGQQHDPFDYQGSRPSQLNRPAEPLGDPSGQQRHPGYSQPPGFPQSHGHQGQQPYQQQPEPPIPSQAQQTGGADDWMLSPPSQPHSSPSLGPAQPQGSGMQAGLSLFQQQSGQGSAPPQYSEQGRQMQSGGHGPGGAPGQHQSQPPYRTQGSWTAVVAPDRDYFLAMMQRSGPDATGLNLPAYSPEQHLPLIGGQITIGRRRQSTGEAPNIDLSVPPEDPGVSHKHAVLVQQQDGSWAVVDQNSTNGTTINGGEEPIQPYVPVALNDGDRVHVGAWTTITIRRG
ncbi:FHA domain-containing protein [Streptomyces albipurpureus]|uniref:FHA domain-containing protein n=1 Tax=Streptomyces albipurpureus TaxID=2897419 RepID=A0ABT0UTT7_9ACTN|nr:FHA domain-containing protein [Streptomyces sp. CWNU-1]MCM2392002.1 FHA domain-containing protein [Streptomyces sp. CWNU-1]